MNSKRKAQIIKLEHWAALIHECMNSGMKVKDWCIHNQISKDTYYYWFKQVREAAILSHYKEPLKTPAFVQIPDAVTFPGPVTAQKSITIHLKNATVEITDQTSPDTLRMVLGVLADA